MATPCIHVAQIHAVEPHPPEGCAECLQTGGHWVHLRMCLTCGHIGCCDSSPGKHATKHFRGTDHPIVRSYEPGENWAWCYADQLYLEPAPQPHKS